MSEDRLLCFNHNYNLRLQHSVWYIVSTYATFIEWTSEEIKDCGKIHLDFVVQPDCLSLGLSFLMTEDQAWFRFQYSTMKFKAVTRRKLRINFNLVIVNGSVSRNKFNKLFMHIFFFVSHHTLDFFISYSPLLKESLVQPPRIILVNIC